MHVPPSGLPNPYEGRPAELSRPMSMVTGSGAPPSSGSGTNGSAVGISVFVLEFCAVAHSFLGMPGILPKFLG